MTVDYDGVIIGGTVQARAAAARGACQGARIALVEPPGAVERQLRRQLTVQVLAQASDRREGVNALAQPKPINQQDWLALGQQVTAAIDIAYPHLGLDSLAMGGVDVVLESGQFSPKPRLVFTTPTRRLRGRSYLLSPPSEVTVPAIPGLVEVPWLTPETLMTQKQLPPSVVILGRSPDAIALAPALARLGIEVTLLTRGEQLLPTEDQDISQFVESLLMAAGVNLRLNGQVTSVSDDGDITIRLATDEPLTASALLLATACSPQLDDLNLQRINLTSSKTHIPVDDQLKTTRPRCFAFGPCLGGYWADHTDDVDGHMALQNAMYLPWRKISRLNRIGWVATAPEFARLGMTASQARRAYGRGARVIQVPFDRLISSHLDSRIVGFCRCIIHQDGQILGAQIIGPRARELAQTLALMVHQRIPIQRIARSPTLPMTYTNLLYTLAEVWQQNRWQPGFWRRDWAENWFNWRRSSFKN